MFDCDLCHVQGTKGKIESKRVQESKNEDNRETNRQRERGENSR